ncbi:MAG: RES family NAD+ phosphorylase [Meiothermus silvanus]|nr:RES family NAD+ phosphorylase [Allomeiothermus silvanus]
MKAWRLTHARWKDTALSGEGASRYPGRWNPRGQRMVYLASSLALAVLETRVHLEVTATEQPYVALEVEFPDEGVRHLTEPLPGGWRGDLELTRGLGSAWLEEGSSPVLAVPSVIIPVESIYLLNPLHPKAGAVRVVRSVDFEWDERLF